MNKNTRISDDRLHSSPKVSREGNSILMRVKVMTPLRLSLLKHGVFIPLIVFWMSVTFMFAVDYVASLIGIYWFMQSVPVTRQTFALILAIPVILGFIEWLADYPACSLIFGTKIEITISGGYIQINRGIFFSRKYSLSDKIHFIQASFHSAVTEPYRRSEQLYAVIGETRKVPICEVWNVPQLERIVTNANAAISITTHEKKDVDTLAPYQSGDEEKLPPSQSTALPPPAIVSGSFSKKSLKKWLLKKHREWLSP